MKKDFIKESKLLVVGIEKKKDIFSSREIIYRMSVLSSMYM